MLVLKLIVLSVVLLALAMSGLGIKILLKKNGAFPEHRIGHNRNMRKKKIFCVNTQSKIDDKLYIKKRKLLLQKQKDSLLIQNINDANLSEVSLATE